MHSVVPMVKFLTYLHDDDTPLVYLMKSKSQKTCEKARTMDKMETLEHRYTVISHLHIL